MSRPGGRAAVVVVVVAALTACSDYLDRRDTLYLGAGDAVRTNEVTHVIDPWPAHARNNNNIQTAGGRVAAAAKRYRCGPGSAAAPGTSVTQSQTSNTASASSTTAVTSPVTGEQDKDC